MSARRRRRKRPTTVSTIRPLPDATARVRDGDETRGKKTRARALFSGRDEIRTIIPSERERETNLKRKNVHRRETKGIRKRRKPLCVEKEDVPSRRLGGFRRDNFRAGKTRALCCKHNVASCRFLLWRVSRETCSFRGHEREREKHREKKGGKSSVSFPSDFLSLFFFPNPKHMGQFFFFEVKREEKKSCHDGWNTTSVVECVQKREKKQRKVDATTTTCRDDPSSLEKKRGGEKTQGKEEGEEHEKARE